MKTMRRVGNVCEESLAKFLPVIGVYVGKNRDERAGDIVILASQAAELKDLLAHKVP